MTDNEIIKSYELCFAEKGTTYTCAICPYHEFGKLCKVERDKDALSLINRQKAEIDRLNNHIAEVGKKVTHCADCQHCALDYADQGFGYPTKPIRVCIVHDHETTLDDYCSWARRKDGGEEDRKSVV